MAGTVMMSPYLRRRGAAEGSVWAVSPKGRGKNGHEYPYLRHEFLAGVYDREFPVNQLAVTPPLVARRRLSLR